MKKSLKIICLAIIALSGCYKSPVQQGNLLKQEDINEVKPGMSKQQVAIILGTPLIADPFEHDRWDYISTNKVKGKYQKSKKFSVFFESDKLIRTEGNYSPEEAQEENQASEE